MNCRRFSWWLVCSLWRFRLFRWIYQKIGQGRKVKCKCQSADKVEEQFILPELARLRDECAALQKVFIPDWSAFQATIGTASNNKAGHRSVLLIALGRGELAQLTRPIHRFLLDHNTIAADTIPSYRNAFTEHWIAKPTDLERHQRFRMFFGKVVELQVADWLENQHWKICNLEAAGGPVDIQAVDSAGKKFGFEVKYIGTEDSDFEAMAQAANGISGGPKDLLSASNYLLFRAYEAAKQLQKIRTSRIAIIVIDNYTAWPCFEFLLRSGFINWHKPSFGPGNSEWNKLLQREKNRRFPDDTENDLAPAIQSLSQVWIFRLDCYNYSREHVFQI